MVYILVGIIIGLLIGMALLIVKTRKVILKQKELLDIFIDCVDLDNLDEPVKESILKIRNMNI